MPDVSSAATSAAAASLLADPDALGAPPGGFSPGVGSAPRPMTMDQALAQKGDGGQALMSYARDHPGDVAKLEDQLLSQGRIGDIHQLAQRGRAQPHVDPAPKFTGPVSQATVDAFKAGDASAVAALKTQRAGLEHVRAQLEVKDAHEFSDRSAPVARKVGAQIDRQLAKVDHELKLRTDASAALQRSTAAHPGDDPAVAAPLAALPHGGASALAKPLDTHALSKTISGLSTVDTPMWLHTPRGSHGPGYLNRPASNPTNSLAGSDALSMAVKAGAMTGSEAHVLAAMSPNEGRLDSVQSDDSEIVTVGAMQKTVNPAGHGELAKQVYDFSQSNPAAYTRLFADKGWTATYDPKAPAATAYTMAFKDPADPHARPMTAGTLSAYIKDEKQPGHWGKTLTPLLEAGRDPAFQAQQVADFKPRLDQAIGDKPTGYPEPISSYTTSEQGAALVLDQSVNRPVDVPHSFGAALDAFYASNPKANRDPANWTAQQRTRYEPQIIANYVAARAQTHMTDPVGRSTRLQASSLSAAPGSFAASAKP